MDLKRDPATLLNVPPPPMLFNAAGEFQAGFATEAEKRTKVIYPDSAKLVIFVTKSLEDPDAKGILGVQHR